MVIAGAILLSLSLVLVGVELFVLRPRSIFWTIRGFSWAFAAVPMVALALGLLEDALAPSGVGRLPEIERLIHHGK